MQVRFQGKPPTRCGLLRLHCLCNPLVAAARSKKDRYMEHDELLLRRPRHKLYMPSYSFGPCNPRSDVSEMTMFKMRSKSIALHRLQRSGAKIGKLFVPSSKAFRNRGYLIWFITSVDSEICRLLKRWSAC